ncbi:MAG: DUF2752 domain-containing protein [Bacteroidia bacterium]|nr:DUF2752 domain-containing protein [Bacteroidia bacterium]
MEKVIHWLESHMMACPYKAWLHVDCPGCGMQRSVIELLKGNFYESFLLYPALLPIFFTFFITFLHLVFKFKNGADWIKYSFFISVAIITINFVVKLFL